MTDDDIRQIAQQLIDSSISVADFLAQLTPQSSLEMDQATLDLDRERRCGFAEVIYAEGKSIEAIIEIIQNQMSQGQNVLATRVEPDVANQLIEKFPSLIHNSQARTIRMESTQGSAQESTSPKNVKSIGKVAVISAGTCDRPVAMEALETLAWMNVETTFIQDVGVAGPQRILQQRENFIHSDAVIVVAGMEGALPSVVGGHVACPVIGVPTSVGYGASFDGLAALLSMLNSCASNVAVVNIDAGFKAGYYAGVICRKKTLG